MRHAYQHGLATSASIVIALVAIAAVLAAYYMTTRPASPISEQPRTPAELTQPETAPLTGASPAPAAGITRVETVFSGTVLAGASAPLLDFTQADYNAALSSSKLIVLYFYANWCPICAKEFPLMQQAFNELTDDQVVGFRVNFNDDATSPEEEALALELGVAYQHTKVFLKGGQRLLISPESWTVERYLAEITQAIQR